MTFQIENAKRKTKVKGRIFRLIAILTILAFLSEQILWANPVLLNEGYSSYETPVQELHQQSQTAAQTDVSPSTTTEFLSDTLVLEKTGESRDTRYSFEDAIDLLRPEYASAVIVKGLTTDNIRELQSLEFETAVVVLHGEIVIFTTGNEEEIGILKPARELLEQASFISHTHITESSQTGPSSFDLVHAVRAPQQEYVITQSGAYAYNRDGFLNDGNPYSLEEYLTRLNQARVSSRSHVISAQAGIHDTGSPITSFGDDKYGGHVTARKSLNEFIAQMDLYNSAPEAEKEKFRLSESQDLMDPSLTGHWSFDEQTGVTIADTSGNTVNGALAGNANWSLDHPVVNYSNVGSVTFDGDGDYADLGSDDILFDSTQPVTVSLWFKQDAYTQQYPGLFVLKTDQSTGFEIFLNQDNGSYKGINIGSSSNFVRLSTDGDISASLLGQWHHVAVVYDGVSRTSNSSYKLYLNGVAQTMIVPGGYSTVPNVNRIGMASTSRTYLDGNIDDFQIYNRQLTSEEIQQLASGNLLGAEPPVSVPEPTVNAIPETTNQSPLILSGAYEAGTTVWVNGDAAVLDENNLTWSYTANLSVEQQYDFAVTAQDTAGNQSAAINASTTYDATPPEIIFTSSDLVSDPDYTLVYTVNGIQKTENRTLIEGENALSVTECDLAGNCTTSTLVVTYEILPPPEPEPPAPADPELAGYWNFDEVSENQISDVSGNGNSGTLVNGVSASHDYPPVNFSNSGSLSFDGSDDYIEIADHPSLNFGSGDFTIGLWIKPGTVTTAKQGILNKSDGTDGYRLITSDTDGDRLKFIRGAYFADGVQSNDGALKAGIWQYVSIVISNDQVMFYVDGVAQGGGTLASNSAATATNLFIGQKGYSASSVNYFDGGIDEVQLFNRALTAEEVQWLASGNLLGTEPVSVPAPTINAVPEYTNQSPLILSGTYEAGITVWVNGESALLDEASLTWSYTANLSVEQQYDFAVTARDAEGNVSSAVNASTTYDATPPEIIFTSSDLVNEPDYTLIYTVNGIQKTENRTLSEGENALSVTECDLAGNCTTSTLVVTYEILPPPETPEEPSAPSFTDNFDRTGGLGPDWTVIRGNYGINDETILYGYGSYPVYDGGVVLNQALASQDYEAGISTYMGGELTARGLLLRYTDLDNYYYVSIDNWGRGKIRKKTDGVLSTIHSFSAGSINTHAWNRISARIEENTIQVSFNGAVKTEFEDTQAPHVSGTAGIYADGYYRSFDDFSVTTIGGVSTPEPVEPPVIEMTSAAVTENSAYLLTYTIDGGAEQSREYSLKEGANILRLEIDHNGEIYRESFWVTYLPPAGTGTEEEETVFSLRTENDEVIEYLNNQILSIQKAGSFKLSGLTFDEEGGFESGILKLLTDGSFQVFENGELIGYEQAGGTKIIYGQNGIEKVIAPDGAQTKYSYLKDQEGNLLQIILENEAYQTVYNSNQKIIRSESKASGRVTEYDNGILKRILEASGITVRFSAVTETDGSTRVLFESATDSTGAALSVQQAGLEFEFLIYDANGQLREIKKQTGEHVLFDESGMLENILDSNGQVITGFDFQSNPLQDLTGISLTQNEVGARYDADGNLSQVAVDGLTIRYDAAQQKIAEVTSADGAVMQNLVFDEQGALLSGRITGADGEVRIYENGRLSQLQSANGVEIDFDWDAVNELLRAEAITLPGELTYTFNYEFTDKIVAMLDTSIVPDVDTVTELEFDYEMNLKKVIKQNNEIISYLDTGLIDRIQSPEQGEQIFTYTQDGTYVVTGPDRETHFNALNQPERMILYATEQNPNELEIVYRLGKIREVYKNGSASPVLKYSYSFKADGTEVTVIEDFEEATRKEYEEGFLHRKLDLETQVLSGYEYQDGQVSRVQLSRLGKPLQSYQYSYEGGKTIVLDEQGVKRIYGEASILDEASQPVETVSDKLLMLEKKGEIFHYAYFRNNDGEEIIEENLKEKVLSGGARAYYELGQIARIERTDGTVITDVVLDDERQIVQAKLTSADGIQTIFKEGAILEEIRPDNTHLYYQNNRISKIETPAGEILEYSYIEDGAGNVTQVRVRQGESEYRYGADDALEMLRLRGIEDFVPQFESTTDSGAYAHSVSLGGGLGLSTDAAVGTASLYFDGGDDYLRMPDHAAFDLSGRVWTMDFWIRVPDLNKAGTFYRHETAPGHFMAVSVLPQGRVHMIYENFFGWNGPATEYPVTQMTGENVLAADTWHHVAIVQDGDLHKIYVDGVDQTSFEDPDYFEDQTIGDQTSQVQLGGITGLFVANDPTARSFNGWLDEFRISKGVVRWSEDFTPPQEPLIADENTSLLLHFDGVDRTHYRFNRVEDENGSLTGYSFDGDGGQISYDASGNLLSGDLSAAVMSGSLASSRKFYEESAGFYVKPAGDAAIETEDFIFGNGAGIFDGAGDYLTLADSSNWDFNTRDFTIETQIKFDEFPAAGQTAALYYQGTDDNNYFMFGLKNTGSGYSYVVHLRSFGEYKILWEGAEFQTQIQTGEWFHVALVKSKVEQYQIYQNGQLVGQQMNSSAMPNFTGDIAIGARPGHGNFFKGKLDEFRISSTARWTMPFTSSEQPYETDAAAKLLLHFDHEDLRAQGVFQQGAARLNGNLLQYLVLPFKADMQSGSYLAKSFDAAQVSGWFTTAKDAVLDGGRVVSQEYSVAGVMETQTKANRTTTLFENNKPVMVTDEDGTVVIEYLYDEAGEIKRVFLRNARDALPHEVAQARASVEEQRQQLLLALAENKQLATAEIQAQVEPVRQQLSAHISQLQSQLNNLESTDVHGKKAKRQKSETLDQIRDALRSAWGQWEDLHRQEADAYAQLDADVQAVSDQIETESQNALNSINEQEAELKDQILLHEISPLIYDAYRKILGRDPSTAEYGAWLERVSYESGDLPEEDAAIPEIQTLEGVNLRDALKNELTGSEEHVQRSAYVSTIKNTVRLQIENYLLMSADEQRAFYENLGLTAAQVIALSSADAAQILAWLDSRTLHFGQSAFLALEALLDRNAISYSREDLAAKAIVTDILAGIITPLDDGDLLISMFALDKVALLYGLELAGAKLSFEDLKAIFAAHPETRVIAFVGQDHYVIITAIDGENVIYIDPSVGRDKENEIITVTHAEFQDNWNGVILLEEAEMQTVSESETAEVLSDAQTQRIRASGFWDIFKSILGIFGSILSFIPGLQPIGIALLAASATISVVQQDFLGAIFSIAGIAGVGGVLNSLGSLFQGVFSGITNSLGVLGSALQIGAGLIGGVFTAIQGAVTNITHGIGGFLGGLPGISSELGFNIARETVAFGLHVGVSKGLEAIGLPSELTNIVSSLATGTLMKDVVTIKDGQTQRGLEWADVVERSLSSSVLINHVGNLGAELELNTTFTSVLGLSLGAIQGQLITDPQTSLESAFKNILPTLSTSLGTYGLISLGENLGLDPAVSRLFSIPLGVVYGEVTHNLFNGLDIGDYVTGIHDVPPAQFTFDTEGAVQSGNIPVSDLLNTATSQPGFFDKLLNTLQSSAISASNFFGPAAFAAIVDSQIDFNQKQISDGLSQTLNDHVTTIFDRPTIENIFNTQGGIDSILAGGTVPMTLPDGTAARGYHFSNTTTMIFDDGNNFLGQFVNGRYELGDFVLQGDDFILSDGQIIEDLGEGKTLRIKLENGTVREITLEELNVEGQPVELASIEGSIENPQEPIFIQGPQGDIQFGNNFKIHWTGVSFEIEDGQVSKVSANPAQGNPIPAEGEINDLFLLVNGMLNSEFNKSPGYLLNLGNDIVSQSNGEVSPDDLIFAPSFFASPESAFISFLLGRVNPGTPTVFGSIIGSVVENMINDFLNAGEDILNWVKEAADPIIYSNLATDIRNAIENYFDAAGEENRSRDIISTGYSGGFMPLSEVIANEKYNPATNTGYNATALVGLGAATIEFEEIAAKIIEMGDLIRSGRATAAMFENFLTGGFLSMSGETIAEIVDFLAAKSSEDAYQRYIQAVNEQSHIMGQFADYNLTDTDVGVLVNVYGTKDVLSDIIINEQAIGGFQTALNGFGVDNELHPLVNIEIVGASHSDYIRRDLFDFSLFSLINDGFLSSGITGAAAQLVEDYLWNKTVSEFVADLTLNSKSKEELEIFLGNSGFAVEEPEGSNHWVIRLPGYQDRP